MKDEKGFTLIEIVMVIILLGILAAVAIPRFLDLSTEAKKSATKGIVGGVRAAIAIDYANDALKGTARYPQTTTELRAAMSDGNIPDNPYAASTQTTKNDVDTNSSLTKGSTTGAGGNEWRYNPTTGQFWSAVSGGVGANGF